MFPHYHNSMYIQSYVKTQDPSVASLVFNTLADLGTRGVNDDQGHSFYYWTMDLYFCGATKCLDG